MGILLFIVLCLLVLAAADTNLADLQKKRATGTGKRHNPPRTTPRRRRTDMSYSGSGRATSSVARWWWE